MWLGVLNIVMNEQVNLAAGANADKPKKMYRTNTIKLKKVCFYDLLVGVQLLLMVVGGRV